MINPGILVLVIVVVGTLFVLVPVALHTFARYRAPRVLVCPERGERARIDIDAPRAALTSAFGRPRLRARWCTLWPQERGCGEGCLTLPEVEKPAPEKLAV